MTRKKRIIVLAFLVPPALALHAWLIWLGGPWRIFALTEMGIGVFLALLMRDLRRLDKKN